MAHTLQALFLCRFLIIGFSLWKADESSHLELNPRELYQRENNRLMRYYRRPSMCFDYRCIYKQTVTKDAWSDGQIAYNSMPPNE